MRKQKIDLSQSIKFEWLLVKVLDSLDSIDCTQYKEVPSKVL